MPALLSYKKEEDHASPISGRKYAIIFSLNGYVADEPGLILMDHVISLIMKATNSEKNMLTDAYKNEKNADGSERMQLIIGIREAG